ncbi:ParB/RepB/Spo0J family partition protein [Seohaeicola zhoushanensis]|uniref:Chromosome segregation DNA-binding protein n=1 Tax=Seohaeicola zhoushanensis TaxID=1569283 RepID=A0A8J3GTQ6_9RHOB|nr:ParB/RepB/Spo0J family partition protein [Seohaeicola zhoushanensis]GHF35406.1 chromosome segregation DNA-binding protein [Seohaeicola zhoushanensis]
MVDKKPRGLGRGLSALMGDINAPVDSSTPGAPARPDRLVPIERVVANPNQPRRDFEPEALNDLSNSIREKGILQPLIVRPVAGDKFEIVAGERRWRAAQLAQLHEVPVLVRDFDDTEVLEVAIIENIQRADLNAVEEAAGYRQLMDKFGHTQERMAEALGKSRSHIANLLRLLNLPDEVQDMLRQGKLSAGHARALVTAPNPLELAREIIAKGLSVRATEELVRRAQQGALKEATKKARPDAEKDADTRALEGDLSAALSMRVLLKHEPGGERGQMMIQYENLEQLDRLCQMLGGN